MKTVNSEMTNAKWITSGEVNKIKAILPPEIFRKSFSLEKIPEKATLRITALGIYEVQINGKKVSEALFSPGCTNYRSHIQVQTYDVSALLNEGENAIEVTVANGWYLGRSGWKKDNINVYGDRRALIALLDLGDMKIATDTTWSVTDDGINRFADFYDGQTIDYTDREKKYKEAEIFDGFTPKMIEQVGTYVHAGDVLSPVDTFRTENGTVYDFGQNFSGVVRLKVKGENGDVITVRHSEILTEKRELFTENYRSAKATLTLICKDGINEFYPTLTYMGFRYAEISYPETAQIISVEGVAFSSYMPERGKFTCSNEKLNMLQNCIVWGEKSNFIDIPTDCPQRDERLGWTGDICVFSNTASFNYDTSVFLRKWLLDVRSEQLEGGEIPMTVPDTGVAGPRGVPVAVWSDAATVVPWNMYMNFADKDDLAACYDSMKKYVLCVLGYSKKHRIGYKQYLWNGNPFQFGDWCAYGVSGKMWNKRGDYLASPWFYNSVNIMLKTSRLLGKEEDAAFFASLSEKIKHAFIKEYLSEDGKLKKADFMTMYVCSLYFGIVPEEYRERVAAQLASLVRENDYKVMTGFPGTPYLLFALADNGYAKEAYRVLLNEDCPSWLHMIKHGATTTWERWDAIEQDGSFFHEGAGMVSFNHYAYGAVGDFFYRRILGLEPAEAGYSVFTVKPVIGGGLTSADGSLITAYGKIEISWKITDDVFTLSVTVPDKAKAQIVLPDEQSFEVGAGKYEYSCKV